MKTYPLENIESLFSNENQTFPGIGVKINPSLEGIDFTEKLLAEKTTSGKRKLLSLEFCWLPAKIVEAYNSAKTEENKYAVLVGKVYSNCRLNCKGCFAKSPDVFKGHPLVHPEKILDLIEEAVNNLGTKAVKYLGPTEFFRDPDVFRWLDRLDQMGVIVSIFVKDPLFGDDDEVEALFGSQGIHTAEALVQKLVQYKRLRILFNFRSFSTDLTNNLVSGGFVGKEDYAGDYKAVQTRALQLFYEYFARREVEQSKEARVVIINAPLIEETVDEAFDIFKYFLDRGVITCTAPSMQSGCGRGLYQEVKKSFLIKLHKEYAKIFAYSLKRGVITSEYLKKYGLSPYAGIGHCAQLCNGLLIRETGQLLRCPGADHQDWRGKVSPTDLLKKGLAWAWPRTKNYKQDSRVNIGCGAKPSIFTQNFNDEVLRLLRGGKE
jgi:hypothetical protein